MGPVTTLLLCWLGAGVTIWALLGGWRRYPEAGDPVTPTVTAPTVTAPPVTRDATAASRSKRYRARKRKRGRPS